MTHEEKKKEIEVYRTELLSRLEMLPCSSARERGVKNDIKAKIKVKIHERQESGFTKEEISLYLAIAAQDWKTYGPEWTHFISQLEF